MSIRKVPLDDEGCRTSRSGVTFHGELEEGHLDDGRPSQTALLAPPTTMSPSPRGSSTIWCRLKAEVDTNKVSALLAAYSFMTGFMDAVSFVAIFVWCGFQTGNFVQLSIAASHMFSDVMWQGKAKFRRIDQQALTSLISFNVGASLGRIGDRVGPCTRLWLIGGTFVQALFTLTASIAIWRSGQPSVSTNGMIAWTNLLSFVCIAFMSASLGLQGIMAKRLNTQFGTTVVLTTIWCELVADRKLFDRLRIPSRDDKFLAVFCIFFGAFVGYSLVDQIGAAGALGVGAGIRALIAIGWLFVPEKR